MLQAVKVFTADLSVAVDLIKGVFFSVSRQCSEVDALEADHLV
jgi:hypothetical protein